jgi:hypothetical protein
MTWRIALLMSALLLPAAAWAQDATGTDSSTGCTALAQAAASGMAATIQADNQSITQPPSVTQLSCLDNFFNGTGLNVITNLLDPTTLLNSVEGKICSAVQGAWQSTIGSLQCGLTVTGFNMGGFGGLGGGNFCPTLAFGGGGGPIGTIGVGANGNGGLYINGQGQIPSGYTLPSTINGLY